MLCIENVMTRSKRRNNRTQRGGTTGRRAEKGKEGRCTYTTARFSVEVSIPSEIEGLLGLGCAQKLPRLGEDTSGLALKKDLVLVLVRRKKDADDPHSVSVPDERSLGEKRG